MSRRPMTIVIFAGFFQLGMLFIMWGILLPDIARNLAMSEVISGALFTLFSLGMMSGAILGGKYASRFDFLSLFAVLCGIDAALLLIIASFSHWAGVLITVFVIGVVSSGMITIGHTLIAQLYTEKRFAMMGLMDFMFSLGTFAASFFVTLLYLHDDNWRLPLRVLAFTLLLLAAYTWMAARQHSKRVQGQPKAPKTSLRYNDVIRQPVFLLLAMVSFGYGAVEFGNANWFVSYASNGLALPGDVARNLLACFTAGMVVSRLTFAYFLRFFSIHRLVVIMASMSLAGAVGVKLGNDVLTIGGGNLLLGLGLGGLFPLMLSAAMNIDAEKGPLLSGVTIIGNSLGVQLASFSTGLWASLAPLTIAFWVIPIAAIWLWATAWFFSRQLKHGH